MERLSKDVFVLKERIIIIIIYIYIYYYIYILYIYIYIYIIYDSKSLDVVQSLYFGSKLPSSELDEGSLLPKYRDCTTSNDFESYLMCCGVMLQ